MYTHVRVFGAYIYGGNEITNVVDSPVWNIFDAFSTRARSIERWRA